MHTKILLFFFFITLTISAKQIEVCSTCTIKTIKEAIEIGRQAKLPIHISHIKCLGVDVWNESEAIIELIKKSRSEGIEITANLSSALLCCEV